MDDTPTDLTGGPGTPAVPSSRMARLFDLRFVIAGVLGLYGVVLVIRGLVDGPTEIAKAAGTAVNLWTGVAMALAGLAFLAWARWRPLGIEATEDLGTSPATAVAPADGGGGGGDQRSPSP